MKKFKKVSILAVSALAVFSLAACGNNNKQSLDSKDTSAKVNKKSASKKEPSKDKQDSATKKAGNVKANQSDNVQTGTTQSTGSQTQVNGKTKATNVTTTQVGKTQQSTKTQARINSADQAADLVSHSMGISTNNGQYKGVAKQDGYHVVPSEPTSNQPEEYVIKPNGDMYDVNGKFMESYSKLAGSTFYHPNGWNGASK